MAQGSAAARKPRTTQRETADDGESVVVLRTAPRARPSEAVPEPDPAELTSPLDSVLAELGSVDDARVMVYRLDKGGTMQYVATMTPEEVQGEASLLESIRQEYGGGTYRIHVRDGSGLLANRRVDIAERKVSPLGDGFSSIAALLDRQQQQLERTLQALVPAARPSAAESEEAMLSRFKIMADILRPQSSASPAATGASGAELMSILMQGIKLGKEMQPGEGAGAADVMVQALSAFAPLMADAARQQRRVIARPAATAASPASARPAVAAPQHQAQEAGDEARQDQAQEVGDEAQQDQEQQLRDLLAIVLRAARADSDPAIYAGMVMDQIGDENMTLLLQQPDPLGMLAQFEPAVSQHREWFERLLNEVTEAINAEPESGDSLPADGHPIGQGGGAANAADHAAAG